LQPVSRLQYSESKLQADLGDNGCLKSASTWKTSNVGSGSMKTCTSCEQELPRDAFRKYSGRSSDGLRPICKECQRAYEADWRKKNVDRLAEARGRRAEKEKAYRQEYDAKNRGRLLLMEAKRRSARKRLPFDLDLHVQEVETRIQAGRCEMTGLPFNMHSSGISWNSPSLHRTDPKQGYVYHNIRVVCFAMNAAMGNWGEATLKTIISAWLERK
jgi:hypothetical protein